MENFKILKNKILETFEKLGLVLTKPIRNMLTNLIIILMEGEEACLYKLAKGLPNLNITDDSKEKKVRRFLANKKIKPILFLKTSFTPALSLKNYPITLSMDRTHWKKRGKHINILMLTLL